MASQWYDSPTLASLDFDSDDSLASRTIWQDDRGFCKEVRRPSTEPWATDSGDSRFWFTLDKLQSSKFWDGAVGMSSFSHCWYEIVESYTKAQLTFSKDKLVAIAGLVQQIQSATNDEHLAGLWKNHLVTDILWFAAEGPGRGLLEKPPKKQAKDSTSKLAGVSANILAGKQGDELPPKQTEEVSPEPTEASADIPPERQKVLASQHTGEASLMPAESSTDTPTEGQEVPTP